MKSEKTFIVFWETCFKSSSEFIFFIETFLNSANDDVNLLFFNLGAVEDDFNRLRSLFPERMFLWNAKEKNPSIEELFMYLSYKNCEQVVFFHQAHPLRVKEIFFVLSHLKDDTMSIFYQKGFINKFLLKLSLKFNGIQAFNIFLKWKKGPIDCLWINKRELISKLKCQKKYLAIEY